MKVAFLIFIAANIIAAVVGTVTKQRGLAAQMAGGRTFRWPPWGICLAVVDLVTFVALMVWLNS